VTEDLASVAETEETVNADPIDVDPIFLERKIGATRASVQLMSGLDVGGKWAAGDSQAFRQLIRALMEVADGATAQVDRARRQVDDLSTGQRFLRDQLRVALDDLNDLHAGREHLVTENAQLTKERDRARWDVDQLRIALDADREHLAAANIQVAELLAEVTKLQAAAAQPQPTMTADVAEVVRLREAFTTEKRRADTAVERMRRMEETFAAVAENKATDVHQRALEAAQAADLAFEEAKWKEGGRYLKLANMWIGLLNAVGNTTQE
jgi:chromosome segregation ATPase